MSDLDTLIVTFQTQLSDVMETVVKTAMYEVTRLVEDGFLEEVKRRSQEVESLRVQLQWAERKLSDHGGKDGGGKTGRCVDCAKKDVELSADPAEGRSNDRPDDVLRGCSVKKEGDPGGKWPGCHGKEAAAESPREADNPAAACSPEGEPQETEEEDVVPAVNVKEEEATKPSCASVNLAGWSAPLDGEAGLEPHSAAEVTEAQPKQAPQNGEEQPRNIIKQGPQTPAAYGFPEEQDAARPAADPAHLASLEMDPGWAGLLHNHRPGAEKDHDATKARGSLKRREHETPDSVASDVHAQVAAGGDQISSSECPKARARSGEALGVTIKQEVVVDSDGGEEGERTEKRDRPRPRLAAFSCSAKQHRPGSEAQKLNHVSHKATAQEVMKLHSKVGAGLRLQAAIQHLHRPPKRTPHALSSGAAAAPPAAHSQVVSLNALNRIPSTSKAGPPPPPSGQRVHLGDRQTWAGVKAQHQSAHSHHAGAAPHLDSHPHAGPRHLLRCGQCGKCFPHPSNLKAHLQTHTGERPFCCSLCGRSFTKLSNLKAHRRVHTGERPYCCLACGKRFTQKCNLKRHQRIHLDV